MTISLLQILFQRDTKHSTAAAKQIPTGTWLWTVSKLCFQIMPSLFVPFQK